MKEFTLSEKIANMLDVANNVFKTPTNVHYNATTTGVYINPCGLLFTSESAYNNWQYYAGLEYVDRPTFMSSKDGFIAYYESGHSDRIDDIIERCQPLV